MASLMQGLRNLKASVGSAASEMQHIANQLQGSAGEEKRFLEAVYANQCPLAASLLEANPNVIFARTKDWHNAWHIAAKAGSLQMLEVLHTHGRGATRKPLPGEPPPHAAKTRDIGKTPLMLACAGNNLNAMHYMLGVGASTRESDKYGNTVVHYAALNGQTHMLSLLLAIDEGHMPEHGVATGGGPGASATTRLAEVRNEAGLQPLHFAVWGGNQATLAALLEHRPDLVAKSIADSMAQVTCNAGSTPLHISALRNDPAMVKALLAAYVRAVNEGRGPRQDMRSVVDNYKFTPHGLALELKREAVQGLLDPAYPLPGLNAAAAEAAALGDTSALRQLRKSALGGSFKASHSNPVEDGFSALAAGWLSQRWASVAVDRSSRTSRARMSSSGGVRDTATKVPVPALTPPPPPGTKTGRSKAQIPSVSGSPAPSPVKVILTVPATQQPSAQSPAAACPPLVVPVPGQQRQRAKPRVGDRPATTPKPKPVEPRLLSVQESGQSHKHVAPPQASLPALVAERGVAPQDTIQEASQGSTEQAIEAPLASSESAHAQPPPQPSDQAAVVVEAVEERQIPAHQSSVKEWKQSEPVQPVVVQVSQEVVDLTGSLAPAAPHEEEPEPEPEPIAAPFHPDDPPLAFLCPITNQLMENPVIAADGRAYEADALELWMMLGNREFPCGGARITSHATQPAHELAAQITAWREAHPGYT